MCNRYKTQDVDAINQMGFEDFDVRWLALNPRYNVAPSQLMPAVVRRDDLLPEATMMRWGFPAHWDEEFVQTNARAETVATSKMFKSAVEKRRCLIPADGFFEWQRITEKDKRPFLFTLSDRRPFYFAGIFQPARDDRAASFAILTTAPNELMQPIHNRMPVILTRPRAHEWLEPGLLSVEKLADLSTPLPASSMRSAPVSKRASNPRNDSPDILQPEPEQPSLF